MRRPNSGATPSRMPTGWSTSKCSAARRARCSAPVPRLRSRFGLGVAAKAVANSRVGAMHASRPYRVNDYLEARVPSFRYLVRELIPRAVLLSVTFKWLMPLVGLFHFSGGLTAALGFGVAFTALFSLFGAYIMPSAPVQAFLNIAIVLLVPLVALLAAALVAPGLFAMNWLYGPFVGSIILNLVCAVTHDYASGVKHRCPAPVCGSEK